MKKIILLLMIVLLSSFAYAEQQDIFQLKLEYNKGEITKNSLLTTKGYFSNPVQTPDDDYTLKIISFNNKILYEQRFKFPLEIFGAPPKEWFDEKGNQIYIPTAEESGYKILDKASVELIIPYFDNAKLINIYDKENNLKLSIDVSYFTQPNIKKTPIKGILYISAGIIILIILFWLYKRKQ
ncbi:MAG: hypothetical protein AABY07_01695 [Nanoarchaeota archaeon]